MDTLLCIKQGINENLLYSTGKYSVLSGDLNGKEIQKRGDICVRFRAGHDNPPQYSCLQNPMDRGAWHTVHGVTKSQT